MVNYLHSNNKADKVRLLIAAAISAIHATHFLTTRLILSAKLSKNEIISPSLVKCLEQLLLFIFCYSM